MNKIIKNGGCIFPDIKDMPPEVVNYNGPFTVEEWEEVMKEHPELKAEYDRLIAEDSVMSRGMREEVEGAIRMLLKEKQ